MTLPYLRQSPPARALSKTVSACACARTIRCAIGRGATEADAKNVNLFNQSALFPHTPVVFSPSFRKFSVHRVTEIQSRSPSRKFIASQNFGRNKYKC